MVLVWEIERSHSIYRLYHQGFEGKGGSRWKTFEIPWNSPSFIQLQVVVQVVHEIQIPHQQIPCCLYWECVLLQGILAIASMIMGSSRSSLSKILLWAR